MSLDSAPTAVDILYKTKGELYAMHNKDIVEYARSIGIPGIRLGMAKQKLIEKIDDFQKQA